MPHPTDYWVLSVVHHLSCPLPPLQFSCHCPSSGQLHFWLRSSLTVSLHLSFFLFPPYHHQCNLSKMQI
jgi:hypothetical protein